MFFVLSKVLAFLIKPLNWIGLLLIYAWFGKRPVWKKRSLGSALLLYFFFSSYLLLNSVCYWWEYPPTKVEAITTPYDIGILLGGYTDTPNRLAGNLHNISERGNRFHDAIQLYHKGKIKKILLSGGSGALLQKSEGEAYQVQRLLLESGIPKEDIITEGESRNTRENALFSKKIVAEQYPGARCLLITSAWHLPRAEACFKKVGLPVDTFGVDYLAEQGQAINTYIFPNNLAFYKWDLLIKEWIGYVAYWVSGYL